MQERDIKRDREMCELALEVFKEDVVADEAHDFSATVTGCASTALDYISRTEHLERMIEAAIGILDALGACPMRAECQRSRSQTVIRDRTECKACLRDYVSQKAKEIMHADFVSVQRGENDA